MIQNIIENIRLPRVMRIILMGAGLPCAGSVLQAIFRHPLVDLYVPEISYGSAYLTALTIAFLLMHSLMSVFAVGVVSVLLTYSFAFFNKKTSMVRVILSGIIESASSAAGPNDVPHIGNPYKLPLLLNGPWLICIRRPAWFSNNSHGFCL
jgi:iron complex transport system permease protein